MEVDWDLHAVVRACCSTASSAPSPPATTATAAGSPPSWPTDAFNHQTISFDGENLMGFFPDPFRSRNDNSIEQFLIDLKKPLHFQKVQKPPYSPQSLPISPLSVIGGLQDTPLNHHHHHQEYPQEYKQVQGKQQSFGIVRCTTSNAQSTRSKKRLGFAIQKVVAAQLVARLPFILIKNQMKRVCQVPAEGLSSDVWSWRKYGQKPIKGSPYPRGYYRCSTSKGCLARKQVERNRSDPDMFIVTYTGEHSHPVPTHRNSLAGSTRNKPTTSGDDDHTTKHKPTSSPPASPPPTHSPMTEKPEDNDNNNDTDDDTFDMVMDDDFFEGLDELVGSVSA